MKKINLFSTLLLIALALGVVSFCTTGESIESVKEGYEDASEMCYERGYEAGLKVKEKIPFFDGKVVLTPMDISDYPEKITNTVTGEEIRMSLRNINVMIPGHKYPLDWITSVLSIIAFFAIFFFIWLLLTFVADVKKGDIFVKSNEWKMNWMAVVFFYWFVADWLCEILYFSFVKNTVAFDGYKVVMEHPSVFPLIIGMAFLLFSSIFSLGRKMKEDQEYMV